jgi:hypothetical protein
LTDNEFVTTAGLRLGLPVVGRVDYSGWRCGQCRKQLFTGLDDLHALSCPHNSLFEERHNMVRDALAKRLDRMVKGRGGSALPTEQKVGGDAPGLVAKKADVLLRVGGQQRWIDLEFRSCAGSEEIKKGSWREDGVANSSTVDRKRGDWKGVAQKDILDKCLVVAAIEDGGRMGDQLLRLLDEVSGMDKIRFVPNSRLAMAKKTLVDEIQTVSARYNSKMISRFLAKLERPAGSMALVLRDFSLPTLGGDDATE